MSRVYTDTIEPRKSTQDITLGTSGETISVAGDSINVNTVKDKGGNTLWTSDGSGNLSSVNAGLKGNLVLLDTNTFSGASSSAFTTLIDSTYDVYKFTWNATNPATDAVFFQFNGSSDNGSNYNVVKTTSSYQVIHYEDNTSYSLAYSAGDDLAQSTNYQYLATSVGNGADECTAGELYLFAPSSTTYVKHFYSKDSHTHSSNAAQSLYIGGYFNTTSAINAIDFKMSSGNMDGTIKMYGLL